MAGAISERLLRALKAVDRPGSFCASGSGQAPLPGLEVTGLGPVGLPLTARQANELKKRCRQAPYGKGEKTVVDTRVRRVWQLDPDRFSLTNPDWPPFLSETVRPVQRELGLEGQKLQCHLYNLLLYEPGSFFLPHRDGEKLDRMIATLVVVLPSSFRGSELVVRHEGTERVIDFGGPGRNPSHTHFAAFYADCEHEIRPLREGHRLCLVYNLTLAKSKKTITAPRTADRVEEVADVLRSWNADVPRKLAVLLEHQYTTDGLVWDTLKGVDRARAGVLAGAASRAGCRAYLALLTLWESAAVEEAYESWDRGRGYDEDDEEGEDGEEDTGDYEVVEELDSTLTAEHWTAAGGDRPPLGRMAVGREEVVPPGSLTKVKPEEDVSGYTGNEGLTRNRWYRHAAVVLWPEPHHFDVLCDCGLGSAAAGLHEMVARWQAAGRTCAADLKARCAAFAGTIIERREGNGATRAPEAGALLMASLARLDDARLIGAFLARVVGLCYALALLRQAGAIFPKFRQLSLNKRPMRNKAGSWPGTGRRSPTTPSPGSARSTAGRPSGRSWLPFSTPQRPKPSDGMSGCWSGSVRPDRARWVTGSICVRSSRRRPSPPSKRSTGRTSRPTGGCGR